MPTPRVHEQKTVLTRDEAKVTSVAAVPELLEAWDDERDPRTTMVWPTGWHGMCPGDGQYRFKCANGHHSYAFPYTYLTQGCPACQANATKGTGLFLADTSPELAAEWAADKNGKWTPENVRQESSRTVWWRCLSCGHEWEATPRMRSRRDGQLCPSCGKILGSIAWTYPRIAAQWDASNPVTPWTVRPSAKLPFIPTWRCSDNPEHVWQAKVSTRVAGGECPLCVGHGRSRIEMEYFEVFRSHFGSARSGATFRDPSFSTVWSLDISFRYRGRTIGVEYDGSYWHRDKAEVDIRKSKELLDAGFVVVRLREDGLAKLGIDSPLFLEMALLRGDSPEAVAEVVIEKLDSLL